MVSEVISMLPTDSQQHLYHRPGGRRESKEEKGKNVLLWLEQADAVAMHLDSLTRQDRVPTSTMPAPKPVPPGGGGSQPVYSASHVTQQGSGSQAARDAEENSTSLVTLGEGRNARTGRIDITTLTLANEVASKRKTNLEAKALDKCPMCRAQHEYKKTWPLVVPPTKVKMVSTLLSSCPQFLAQPTAQKMVSVTSHAACPTCMSWEHSKHRQGGRELPDPKCKILVAGVECGGRHGKWFHQSASNMGNMVAGPPGNHLDASGLYEVYRGDFVNVAGGVSQGTIMIDSGSNTDYIQHDFAATLGLVGEQHQCRIKVIDTDYRTVQTLKYQMTVRDIEGVEHTILALGLDSITTLPNDPDLSPLLPLLG